MACVSDYKSAYTPHNKTLTCTFSSADVMNPFLLCEKSCLEPRHFHTSEVLISLPADISVQGQKVRTREKEKPPQPLKTSTHPWSRCGNAGNYLRNKKQLGSVPDLYKTNKEREGLIQRSGLGVVEEQVILGESVGLTAC